MTDPAKYKEMLARLCSRKIRIMEVCGTHTMAIAKAGIRNLLPDNIKLISGPGCPVCVTDQQDIDRILELSGLEDIIIASYGDMLRVPGSIRGDSLLARKAKGAQVEVVYSPVDAVELALRNKDKRVVFIGVGFETTAPGTASAVLYAEEKGAKNFFLLSLMKRVEPSLRALIARPDFNIDGFLCPGHVATITGANAFRFLPEEYGLPAVVSGFEAEDILLSIYEITRQIAQGEPGIFNEYKRAVTDEGNEAAMETLNRVFEPAEAEWRGLGSIAASGLKLRQEYGRYDIINELTPEELKNVLEKARFNKMSTSETKKCVCGDVICGIINPLRCIMFGKVCTPANPLGHCMVSSEGSCAAAYKYCGVNQII